MIAILIAGLGAEGCSSQQAPELTFGASAASASMPGDWDDIDAAVLVGANKAEWVVSRWWWSDEQTRNYDLRNARGDSGSLRIRRGSGEGDVPLELTVSIGPFGDAAAEQTLIAQVRARLEQLHGVDAAAIK